MAIDDLQRSNQKTAMFNIVVNCVQIITKLVEKFVCNSEINVGSIIIIIFGKISERI